VPVVTISSWLNFGGPAPLGRGSAAGENFGSALLQPSRTLCVFGGGDCGGRSVCVSLSVFHWSLWSEYPWQQIFRLCEELYLTTSHAHLVVLCIILGVAERSSPSWWGGASNQSILIDWLVSYHNEPVTTVTVARRRTSAADATSCSFIVHRRLHCTSLMYTAHTHTHTHIRADPYVRGLRFSWHVRGQKYEGTNSTKNFSEVMHVMAISWPSEDNLRTFYRHTYQQVRGHHN